MFWRSVVGKLAITILLLVSFVLFILTILLLEFFENFHVQEVEKELMQTATQVSLLLEHEEDSERILDTIERIKDPSSKVVVFLEDHTILASETTSSELMDLDKEWYEEHLALQKVLINREDVKEQVAIDNHQRDMMIIGTPITNGVGAVFVFQSLDIIDHTKAETTRIIFLAAGIAIFLTTIFAFFLSTRITSPLIKMREAAFDLTRGEFNTKVPILTHDEIGELAIAFNRMGRQLKFHINALRQEKEQLSSIVRSMADGVITINRHGEMIVTNPPAEKFIEDLYFHNNIELVDAERKLPLEIKQVFDQVVTGEKEVLQELSVQGRNWVMIMTPLYDQTVVRGAVAVIRDMTEERRLDKLRKDFISNVSHELRTPISLMQGYSEAIMDDIADSKEEKNELAKIINEESLRMGRLVNELLDLSRMETGHFQLNTETIQVSSFIQRILNKFRALVKENNIRLELTADYKFETAILDPDRMEQVFTNLIDNAITHTRENGYVHVLVNNTKDHLSVEIRDNGSGIPEEDLPFIFERFYKADKSRTRNAKQKGTGLGLAIVKNIIEAHQGTISVKSKVGIGTTFSFKIPQ